MSKTMHLLGSIRRGVIKSACGVIIPNGTKFMKFDEVHRNDTLVDCPKCSLEVIARLKQKRDDLSHNAVAIHTKQVLVNEALGKYTSIFAPKAKK